MSDQHQKKSESLEDFEEISPSSVEMVTAEYKYTADDLLAVREELEKIGMVKKADFCSGLSGSNAAPNTPVEKPMKSKPNWDHLFGNNTELLEENRKLKEEIEGLKAKMNENPTEQANPLEAMKKLASDISFATNKMKSKIRELESLNLFTVDDKGNLVKNEANKNAGILDYIALLKESIWTVQDAGKHLPISEDGVVVENKAFCTIRGNIPIKIDLECPKEYIACYYEVHIRSIREQENNQNAAAIFIGFCSDQFALGEAVIGKGKNSVGICGSHGVHIDGFLTRYMHRRSFQLHKITDEECFWREGDVVGCGLICVPAKGMLKCFFTCNGDVLDWTNSMVLPSKFVQMKLFPAVTMYEWGDCISANFGKNPWRYDVSKHNGSGWN